MSLQMSRRRATMWYRKNVSRPWLCDHCGGEVITLGVGVAGVHHRDGDPFNNEPSNLGVMHASCHNSHHKRGAVLTQETRVKLSAAQKQIWAARKEGKIPARVSRGTLGYKHTDETRAKMREAWTRRRDV